ncbi:hypothetical protein PQR39_35145 [Paraburkholderia sediminicola]|uniref:hypothetical protein n=1 Tax=Paraburkholderia sediminicola TaxID=458836 RepID=UPI0038BBE741
MDNHEIFEAVLAVLNLLIAGFAFVMWQNLQDARSDAKKSLDSVAAHELYCARTYVTQEGLTQAIQNLEKTIGSLVEAVQSNMTENRQNFRDLYEKMNNKQDKEK